jgi:hypothetical protein
MIISVKKFAIGIAALLLAGPAMAAQYQVTYGWTDPTTYLPSDEPDYAAQYRVNAGAPVVLPATTVPGGVFALTADPAAVVEMCVQNRNGALVTPADCDENWIAVGNAPVPPPTQPLGPTGFSATIIYTGP